MKHSKLFITILCLFAGFQVMAQKDTLISSTGDIIIGEIKSMNRNVLIFDTDYADSEFEVEWANVKGLVSSEPLQIYTTNGEKLKGKINYIEGKDGVLVITGSEKDGDYPMGEIVEIATTNSKFLDRIYISIGAGYSFTKANHVTQLTTNGRVSYKADNWLLGGGFNNVVTNQDGVDATSRNEANVDFNRDIVGRAFAFAGMEFLANSEQNLDLRTTSKVGVGYYFVRENGFLFQGGVGLANANEKYGAPDNTTENSFEGLGAVEVDAYDIGDFSFRAKVNAFPSFSNAGRVRINSDVSLKWDLPLDFFIKTSLIHNYDSKPLVAGNSKSDYVFQTSIGWEWD